MVSFIECFCAGHDLVVFALFYGAVRLRDVNPLSVRCSNQVVVVGSIIFNPANAGLHNGCKMPYLLG